MREKQVYLGSKNRHLGSADSGKYPKSVPTYRVKAKEFYEQKDGGDYITHIKERKILSVGSNSYGNTFCYTLMDDCVGVNQPNTSGTH